MLGHWGAGKSSKKTVLAVALTITILAVCVIVALTYWLAFRRKKKLSLRFPDTSQDLDGKHKALVWRSYSQPLILTHPLILQRNCWLHEPNKSLLMLLFVCLISHFETWRGADTLSLQCAESCYQELSYVKQTGGGWIWCCFQGLQKNPLLY